MTLEELYNKLGTMEWVGQEKGWNSAIEAVRRLVREKCCPDVVKEEKKEYYALKPEKDTATATLREKCLFDSIKDWEGIPAMGLACTCPKCSPR